MSASTSGALKAFIEGLGLGISVYRDRAPEKTPLPYIVVNEALAIVPDKLEDGVASTCRETVQISVFQMWKNQSTGAVVESYTLANAVARGLQGQPLNSAPTRAYATVVQRIGPRLVEEESNLTHWPISAVIWRVL